MANKAISELPQAQNVNNQDLFVLEQSGIAKKLPAETFITEQGIINALAEALDGHGGIQSVTLSSVSGRIRTYRIIFTDQSATTFQVYDGTSIDRISRTSSSGLDDVYTIFLSDGTTTFFTVHNGADGDVSEAMLNDALKDKAPAITETTESSAIANFTDGADDMVMHNVVAEINPVQDLTYGDPYPAGGGKNKLPAILNTIKSLNIMGTWSGNAYMVNGLTFTVSANDEGAVTQISVSGTASANSVFIIATPLSVTSGQILNGAPSEGRFFVSNSTGTMDYAKDLGSGATISTTDDSAYCYIQVLNGTTLTGAVYKPMLRDSSVSDATFAPYSNICPISGWTGCNVTRTGKNLSGATTRQYNANNIFTTGTKLKSGTYTASFTWSETLDGLYVKGADNISAPNIAVKYNGNTVTFTLTEATEVFVQGLKNTGVSASAVLFQIELGSTATTYEPYQSDTLTVDWTSSAGTVYGGTIDVATGLLTVTNGYIASYNGEALPSTWISDRDVYSSGTTPTTGAQVVYVLATPQTYQLTPQEVKTLLGTNNVWADTGNTSVTYVADTKMFIEKLTMPTEDDMVANQAITSGKYFMIGNSLYLALANIASGAQITIGTNAQRVSLADALNTINS